MQQGVGSGSMTSSRFAVTAHAICCDYRLTPTLSPCVLSFVPAVCVTHPLLLQYCQANADARANKALGRGSSVNLSFMW